MHATRYMDDHAAVVPRRATGYEPAGTGFRVALSNWEQLGDGAVQTSIADLLKWDANFYAPTVGGARLVQALQSEGRLASESPSTTDLACSSGYGACRRSATAGRGPATAPNSCGSQARRRR